KAGEKIVENENLTLREYFRLGVFRKSNYFYVLVALFYLYWLFYGICYFKKSRNEFDVFVKSFRGFHSKNIIMMIYVLFIILAVFNMFYTLEWVQYYTNAKYDKSIRFASDRSTCYMDEMATELDEIESFHNRVQRYYHRNIQSTVNIENMMRNVVATFENNCNSTTSQCGEQKMSNWSIVADFKTKNFVLNFDTAPKWNECMNEYKELKQKYLKNVKPGYSGIVKEWRERLTLLKNVYIRIERLFVMPDPSIISYPYWMLFIFCAIVVLISICSLVAMFRDHNYLSNNGIAVPLASYLKKLHYFIVGTTCIALLWSWIVILFSSASHSLYLNVLRDSEMEVLGKLNISTNNGTVYYRLIDFLNSTDETVIEELLGINSQEILKKNETLMNHFSKWRKEVNWKLNKNISFYEPIQHFCEEINTVLDVNEGKWINKIKLEFNGFLQLCELTKRDCFFCGFKKDLEQTERAAKYIRELSLTVANRSGDDLEDFRFLHEKYRLQMWSDYVAPITFLEVPSIVFLIILYVLSLMLMISISFVENEHVQETFADRYEFYKLNTADRGLYWFNN
ncbi:hypothetical protein CAEBREN_29704, partial [Caenorhabditis brenneri]